MSMSRGKHRTLEIVIASCFSLSVFAGGSMAQMSGNHSSADSKFAADAASGGMAEVKMGQLAQQNGSSDSVKSFGQRMVTDHSKAGDDLKGVAQGEGISIPSDLSREDQMTYDRLSKLHGAQFDKAYAQDMVKDHQKDVAAFEKESSGGQDPALKDFANRTLPTLKDHLKMAQGMDKSGSMSSMSSQ